MGYHTLMLKLALVVPCGACGGSSLLAAWVYTLDLFRFVVFCCVPMAIVFKIYNNNNNSSRKQVPVLFEKNKHKRRARHSAVLC